MFIFAPTVGVLRNPLLAINSWSSSLEYCALHIKLCREYDGRLEINNTGAEQKMKWFLFSMEEPFDSAPVKHKNSA